MKNFLSYITFEKRFSKHTIVAYETDLNQFANYLNETYEITQPELASHSTIRSWIVALIDAGISTRSVYRKISSLKSYYKYLKRNEEISVNPMQKVIAPRTSKRIPIFVDEPSMEKLFNEIQFSDDFDGKRARLILELFYGTGMRLSELINLKIPDVDLYKHSVKVIGKRNKERIIPISREIEHYLLDYQETKKNHFQNNNSTYILVTDKGKKIYEKFVYRIVNYYLAMVTTVSKKSPHILRHTFATHMLNNGADLNTIKEILGHANLAATQIYTHNSIEKLKSIYKQAHPKGA